MLVYCHTETDGKVQDKLLSRHISSVNRPAYCSEAFREVGVSETSGLVPGASEISRQHHNFGTVTLSQSAHTLVHGFNTVLQVHVGTLYTVRLTHGHFHWTVKRKYKHFQELHRDLYKHRMMLQLLPLARSVRQSVCANKSIPSESRKIKSKYSLAGACLFFFSFFFF